MFTGPQAFQLTESTYVIYISKPCTQSPFNRSLPCALLYFERCCLSIDTSLVNVVDIEIHMAERNRVARHLVLRRVPRCQL